MATPLVGPKKKNKYVALPMGPSTPKPAWGQQNPSSILVSKGPVVTPTAYQGPPLTNGPIAGTTAHLQAWIDTQVGRLVSWCDVIGGSFKDNQGPGYPHVVSAETYQAARTWWELKRTVDGPNGKRYSCDATDPSEKGGRVLLATANQQGNILASTGSPAFQTRLNLHVDIT
jgi:hypothetical protein